MTPRSIVNWFTLAYRVIDKALAYVVGCMQSCLNLAAARLRCIAGTAVVRQVLHEYEVLQTEAVA
jgi:hypothetical protein